MYQLYCLVYQKITKLGMYLLPWKMPEMIKGEGSIRKLPALISKNNFHQILIVTGPKINALHLLDPLRQGLDQEKINYVIFDDLSSNPTDEHVEKGVTLYKQHQCEAIIAFGGGAVMDCAKAIGACIARPKKTIRQLQGLFKVLKPIPILYAVPTTSGTGSETTIAAVIVDSKTQHKAPINDMVLMPKYCILDPLLTVGLSPKITAMTGMDALCHAIEAYTNHTYNTKLENKLCLEAVKMIHEHLYLAYKDGNNIESREALQEAAFYAGRAFTRGCVGYVHAIGHGLSGLYDIHHGEVMGILLPHVLRAYGPAVYPHLAKLCDVCNLSTENQSIQEKAESFIKWIEDLKVKMNIPKYPTFHKEDIDQIVRWAHQEANPLYPTPVTWNEKGLKSFLLDIYRGSRK